MPKQKLTDKSIRGLKAPTSGNVDYWDELLPGLAIRVGHGGTKSFFVGTRVKGRFGALRSHHHSRIWSWRQRDRRPGISWLMLMLVLDQS